MRFLPFIKGQDFLVVYAIYAIIGIIIIARRLARNDCKDFVISELNQDKYYVLRNKYNINNMFYYITYKLYAKGILIKDEEDKKFYVNKQVSVRLSNIEEQVYILYLDKFASKDFRSNMVNENDFKDHYENINNVLERNGLIKDSIIIKKNKTISNIGLIIILIPGILRLIGGIASEMPVTGLIIEIIVIFIMAKAILLATIKDKLTNKGKASMNAYERYYESMENNVDNINNNEEYNTNIMHNFFITNAWMNFLDVDIENKSNSNFFNNDSGSGASCSSCSSSSSDYSSSSDSSGSSCSSCGGCGGGD